MLSGLIASFDEQKGILAMKTVACIPLLVTACILSVLPGVLPSYLGYPRIHFAGQFRGDANTRNNDPCDFRKDKPLNSDLNNLDWNRNGTNEFQFINTKVTSVVYSNGTLSLLDPVVGHRIIDNLNGPPAKMSDTTNVYAWHCIVFGLMFGIQWDGVYPAHWENNIAFHGTWVPNTITQYRWRRMKCYSYLNSAGELPQNAFHKSAQTMSMIRNISWGNLGESEAVAQLREAAGGGDLAVRITMHYHTTNYPPYVAHNATIGYVVGAIGIPSASDTLNVPGERILMPESNPLDLVFEPGDLCYGQDYFSGFYDWVNNAPFEFDKDASELRVDLSNSLPANRFNSLRDIGILRLGVIRTSCIYLFGDEQGLPYSSTEDYPVTSAIYTVPVAPSFGQLIADHHVVLVQVLAHQNGRAKICNQEGSAQILLKELPYYVRPMDAYTHYMDRFENPTVTQGIYVTRYGKPLAGVPVYVFEFSTAVKYGFSIFTPEDLKSGIVPVNNGTLTDENGIATFIWERNKDIWIPTDRRFSQPICAYKEYPADDRTTIVSLPGQPYFFYYCVDVPGTKCSDYAYITAYFQVYSDVNYTRPYTWVDHVGPIFTMYARVAPMMQMVLNLADYNVVTQPHNLHLLNRTLRLDFEHPSYMPTTRDLSPAKRKMILEWLEDPKYDLLGSNPPSDRVYQPLDEQLPMNYKTTAAGDFLPPRCASAGLHFEEEPHQHDPYFHQIFLHSTPFEGNLPAPRRPLFRHINCSLENLRRQLQLGIQLEWSTLPIYLTSLYTIVENKNWEVYNVTRTVVMQEMLHMLQVANILIAMNGLPLIDDPSVIPTYPVTGLPGGVFPNLKVTLEKFSLDHIYRVFLGIEMPQKTLVGTPQIIEDSATHTIGMFYSEIKSCINFLGDEIFDPSTVNQQVHWPWKLTAEEGWVTEVTDAASAVNALDLIVTQGEGASILDPKQVGVKTLAHFFKFEEIVCQRHLEKVSDHQYAYVGAPVVFNPEGVSPMRPNPKISTLIPNTNCYYESRMFHHAYRSLLHKLQAVFSGHPGCIFEAVQLMESMLAHAKRLMYVEYNPDDPHDHRTCGLVWEYDWPDD